MKTIVSGRDACLGAAADHIAALLTRRPSARIALGANDDCLALYRELSRRCRAGLIDCSKAIFFAATEFDGLSAQDSRSCRARLESALLSDVDPREERSVFLSAEQVDAYDRLIDMDGGLDLAILGVGQRGRIGFNEPATPFTSPSHRQKLTMATRRELADLFGGAEKVPDFGLTIGIGTITKAREILVLALGEDKADPVFRMLYARNDSAVPAAFLQLPPEVTVYLDEAAASRLS